LAVDNINTMFRNISELDTTDIPDVNLQATYIPLGLQYLNKMCRVDYTISDYTAGTVGTVEINDTDVGNIIDHICANITAYFAWTTHRMNFTIRNSRDFPVPDEFLRNAWQLMAVVYDDVVVFNDKLAYYIPADKLHDTPDAYMTCVVGDSTKEGGFRSVDANQSVSGRDR